MSDQELKQQIEALELLSLKYPGKDDYEIYMLDNIERILTNNREQTKYLKNISGIITALVILAVIGWFITLILG